MSTIKKKRGRKPKGGQIVTSTKSNKSPKIKTNRENIILHLKTGGAKSNAINSFDCYNKKSLNPTSEASIISDKSIEIQDVYNKIKMLQINLHNNNINQRSACHWCTEPFNTPPIYIPSSYINNKYNVYGCFCSPQCAAAFLFNEDIDSSSKYDRYSMLNLLYCKLYNYTENIIPAPNVHYTLDKFYGNLSINEFRDIINNNDTCITILDKPISKIFPELHNENTSNPQNIYKKYYNSST